MKALVYESNEGTLYMIILDVMGNVLFVSSVPPDSVLPMIQDVQRGKSSPLLVVQSEKYDWLAIVTKRPVEELISVGYIEIGLVRPYDKEEDSTFYYVRSNCLTPCTLQTYKRKCSRVFPSHRIAKIQISKMLNKSPFLSYNLKKNLTR